MGSPSPEKLISRTQSYQEESKNTNNSALENYTFDLTLGMGEEDANDSGYQKHNFFTEITEENEDNMSGDDQVDGLLSELREMMGHNQ